MLMATFPRHKLNMLLHIHPTHMLPYQFMVG